MIASLHMVFCRRSLCFPNSPSLLYLLPVLEGVSHLFAQHVVATVGRLKGYGVEFCKIDAAVPTQYAFIDADVDNLADDVSVLNMPPQDDLRIGFSVLFTQLGKQGLFYQCLVAVAQGVPCLNNDSFLFQELFQLFLLGVGMNFRLQYRGLDLADAQNFLVCSAVKLDRPTAFSFT